MAPTFLPVRPPAPCRPSPPPAASLQPPRPLPGLGRPSLTLRGPGSPARSGAGRPLPSFPKAAGEEAVLQTLVLFTPSVLFGIPKALLVSISTLAQSSCVLGKYGRVPPLSSPAPRT